MNRQPISFITTFPPLVSHSSSTLNLTAPASPRSERRDVYKSVAVPGRGQMFVHLVARPAPIRHDFFEILYRLDFQETYASLEPGHYHIVTCTDDYRADVRNLHLSFEHVHFSRVVVDLEPMVAEKCNADVGPRSGRRRSYIGPTSLRHRSDVGPTSLRRRSDVASDVAPTSGRRRSDVGPTSLRHRSDIGPTSLRCRSDIAQNCSVVAR